MLPPNKCPSIGIVRKTANELWCENELHSKFEATFAEDIQRTEQNVKSKLLCGVESIN